jgi:ATP-dependent DNA helicase RecG
MNEKNLLERIRNGENETTEFKTNFSKDTIETLVAFANKKGGMVLVGVDNQAKIVGTTVANESVQKWLNEIKFKTEPAIFPDIDILNIEGKDIAIFRIQEYPVKPISFLGRFFIRKNNSNHQLAANEINEIYLQSIQTSWDSYTNLTYKIVQNIL